MTKRSENKKLVTINFDHFKERNPNYRESFESLCYLLFCRRYKITTGIFRYKNQTGIETSPIKDGKKYVGFQSKFFEGSVDFQKISSSLDGAKSKNKNLNKVIFYINREFSESSTKTKSISKSQEKINKKARDLGVEIEWVVPSNFEILLNQPSNIDLAQVYFGEANELDFIKNSTNQNIQTFLQSSEYIDLPITLSGKIIEKPLAHILKNKTKNFLLIGHPGSGKSYLVHKFFRDLAGLDKKTHAAMCQHLVKRGFIPTIINLKDCLNDSLESLIQRRQDRSNVNDHTLGFAYLFDGLDELGEEKADQVLSYINELSQKDDTKKIIISCRSGNPNRLKAYVYFPKIPELEFGLLGESFVDEFFKAKGDKSKNSLLKSLGKNNKKIISESKDILLIRLLWETIENIGPHSNVTDLIETKVHLLLNSPEHKKNIDGLNLLDSKCDSIIDLNRDISYIFQQKFQYRFPQRDLQEIIGNKLSKLDYKSINEILNYLSNLFFDRSSETGPGSSYVYQHRRYQEFFFTQRLKEKYETNPKILRELDILSNRDYFEEYFMPYLRKEYEKNKNIIGLLDLNLLDVYLGKHSGYGVDDAYYLNSSEFIPAIASQNKILIDELIESDTFQVKKILFIDIDTLKDKFKLWAANKNDFSTNDYLSSIWSAGISSLLENIVIFLDAGQKDLTQKRLLNLKEVQDLYKENRYFELVDKERRPSDPFWKQWKSYLSILIRVHKKSAKSIFNDLVRKNYEYFPEKEERIYQRGEGKEKLVESFFTALLKYKPADLLKIIDSFDNFEFLSLLNVLSSYNHLSILIENKKITEKIKSLITSKGLLVTEDSIFIAFYKRLFEMDISDAEKNILNNLIQNLRNERGVDWQHKEVYRRFALAAFALDKFTFSEIISDTDAHFRYYDELALYAAIFNSFIKILNGSETVAHSIRNYLDYVDSHDQRLGSYLKVETSFLWAYIFSFLAKANISLAHTLKIKLLQEGTNVIPWSFYFKLSQINKIALDNIVNESDLLPFETNLEKADDYQSLVNECFALGIFYSNINSQKSKKYFVKGLKDSILRHGWRKDSLVSHQLVDMLDILWKSNCYPREKLIELTNEVFDLTLRVGEFTDGAVTWHGPYNVIDLASRNDLALAESLKNKLIEKRGHHNFNNLAVTTFLLGKVRIGLPIEDIEKGMSEFRKDYDYEGKPNSSSYDEKFKVYVSIADSDFYSDSERKAALEKAHKLVEEMKTEGVTYYLRDLDYKDIKLKYVTLCQRFKITSNVEFDEKDSSMSDKKYDALSLQKMIRKLDSKSKIRAFYKKVEDYKNGIVLDDRNTWELLVNKTYGLLGNIQPLIKLLERFSFPHTDWYTNNSKYFHIGVAVALSKIETRSEIIRHLYRNTGHGGFNNMAKSYELIGDKDMCKALFERYIKLCHFLSD